VRYSFDSTIYITAKGTQVLFLKQLINKKLQQHNSHIHLMISFFLFNQHTQTYLFQRGDHSSDNDDVCLVLLREGRRASAKRKRSSVVQIGPILLGHLRVTSAPNDDYSSAKKSPVQK
jgi:hypothetical protein